MTDDQMRELKRHIAECVLVATPTPSFASMNAGLRICQRCSVLFHVYKPINDYSGPPSEYCGRCQEKRK